MLWTAGEGISRKEACKDGAMPKEPPPTKGIQGVDRQRASRSIDEQVGINIRLQRKMRGLSQQALASAIGVTFQQLQKYERGANRVSASSMWMISRALNCHPAHLFEGVPAEPAAGETEEIGEFERISRALLASRGGFELAKAYLAMPEAYKRALLAAARSLAGQSSA
jgi:transcriptional regulator with XRE-family HTH domain